MRRLEQLRYLHTLCSLMQQQRRAAPRRRWLTIQAWRPIRDLDLPSAPACRFCQRIVYNTYVPIVCSS